MKDAREKYNEKNEINKTRVEIHRKGDDMLSKSCRCAKKVNMYSKNDV